MRDTLENFIVVHPYTNTEFIQPELRDLGCSYFSVIDSKSLNDINIITSNMTRMDSLRLNPSFPDVSFNPSCIFIQEKPVVKGIGDRVDRLELIGKEIEVRTKMSLLIPQSNMTYWEESVSLHDYFGVEPSILNSGDYLYQDTLIKDLVHVSRYIKGSRFTLRFNYESFLRLCKHLGKTLRYV